MKNRPDTPAEARFRREMRGQIAELGAWDELTEEMLDSAVERVAAYNAAMEPFEEDFLAHVERLKHIGYGRMIQLIAGEWDKLVPGIAARWRRP